jgi:hypothetical protein
LEDCTCLVSAVEKVISREKIANLTIIRVFQFFLLLISENLLLL